MNATTTRREPAEPANRLPAREEERKPATARLFVALWPGPAVRDALRAARDAWRWPPRAAPVAADKLHLTLHFIGSVPAGRVADIAAALRGVPVAPFELRLSQPALWPHGIAVLEMADGAAVPARLAALHAALGDALRALALPVETRRLRPHVTLARHAQGATPPAAPPALSLRWPVRGCALVESRGGAYRVLERWH